MCIYNFGIKFNMSILKSQQLIFSSFKIIPLKTELSWIVSHFIGQYNWSIYLYLTNIAVPNMHWSI